MLEISCWKQSCNLMKLISKQKTEEWVTRDGRGWVGKIEDWETEEGTACFSRYVWLCNVTSCLLLMAEESMGGAAAVKEVEVEVGGYINISLEETAALPKKVNSCFDLLVMSVSPSVSVLLSLFGPCWPPYSASDLSLPSVISGCCGWICQEVNVRHWRFTACCARGHCRGTSLCVYMQEQPCIR